VFLGEVMVAANFSLPDNMKFGSGQVLSIIAYTIMLIIGLTTNTTSLFYLVRDRMMKKDRNRMSLLLIHLSVADLLVSRTGSLIRMEKYNHSQLDIGDSPG
jgi:hypothetical protein